MLYKGQITIHSEMCCGSWPSFHDDRGLHGDKKQYWNWDWTINFNKKTKIDKITIFDADDNIVYTGSWTFDRTKIMEVNYMVAPKEIELDKWLEYLYKDYRCEIETDELVDALKEGYKESN